MVYGLDFTYKNFLNTHSHIALLGWLYNLFLVFLANDFFKEKKKRFNQIFWITQFTFLGMLFSFPFVGYAPISIVFSTSYLFASYWLIVEIFKSKAPPKLKYTYWMVKAGGFFLFLSSLGPYALGYFMSQKMQGSAGHHLSLYWFLHFLFNGFFFMIFLAMLIFKMNQHFTVSEKKQKQLFYLFSISTVPLYAQFALMVSASNVLYLLSFLASVMQVSGLYLFRVELLKLLRFNKSLIQKMLLGLVLLAFIFKLLFQIVASLPVVRDFVAVSKSTLIIGFIHLIMLGLFSLFFVWYYRSKNVFATTLTDKIGVWFFVCGVVFSEVLLFLQSFVLYFFKQMIPNYYHLLYMVSSLMVVGLILMLVNQFIKPKIKVINS